MSGRLLWGLALILLGSAVFADSELPSCSPTAQNSPAQTVAGEAPGVRYRTGFAVDGWTGELSKEQLSATGEASVLWRASEQMANPRRIQTPATAPSSDLTDFTWANLSPQLQAALNSTASGVIDGYGPARVSLLRGESCSQLEGCASLRQGLPPLGDIVHSSAWVVAAPNRRATVMEHYDGPPGAYAAFQAKPRRTQVYVGSNDGMLHGFDAASGEERLAIIPTAMIAALSALTAPDYGRAGGSSHRFFVDGPLLAQDVYYDQAWHTVLLVTFGAGAPGLMALEVSDPDQVHLLWELSSSPEHDLGHLLGPPTIARLHSGQWAAVLGNGSAVENNSAALLLVDIHTGALIKRLQTPQPTPGLAMPLVADSNADGNADYAYAGDDLGNLWRFDLYPVNQGNLNKSAPETPATAAQFRLSFGGRPLFSTVPGQPISLAPAIVGHPTEKGYLVILGSGRNDRPDAPGSHARQSLYGIWDRYTQGQNTQTTATVSADTLQEQHLQLPTGGEEQEPYSLTRQPIDWDSKSGWYLELQPATADAAAERQQEPAQPLGELLFLRTRRPSLEPCQADRERRLYVLDPTLGGRPLFPVFDLNGDGRVDEQDTVAGLPPSFLSAGAELLIVPTATDGMPCLLDAASCSPLAIGPRANGRQSWRVVTDALP
ncbi:Tfp pilus tip-associated adhesin PilY1 [Pseudomonas sp. TE3786]